METIPFAGTTPYQHMDHLREFERRVDDTVVPPWLQRVATPLIWREWDRDLISHPDPEFRPNSRQRLLHTLLSLRGISGSASIGG